MLLNYVKSTLLGLTFLLGATSMANADEYKTYCIGRLLIDIPASFELVRHSGWSYASELERLGPGGPEEAERIAYAKALELRDNKTLDDDVPQLFMGLEKVGDIHIVSRKDDPEFWGDYPDLGIWFEDAYFSSKNVLFRATNVLSKNDELEQHEKLIRVAKATTPREPDEIPNKEGSCVDGAFIALPPEGETQGALFMPIHEQPIAIEFTFSLRKPGGRQLGLEGAQGSLGRRISIAGLNGRYAKDYADKGFMFYAAVGQQTTENQFGLSLRIKYFDTRSDFGKAPYTRQKADEIWDRLVNSARIRH